MNSLSYFNWNHRKWRMSLGVGQVGSAIMAAAERATSLIVCSLFRFFAPLDAKLRAARTQAPHWRLSSRRIPTVLAAIAALVALTFVLGHLLTMVVGAPVFSEPTSEFSAVASKPVTAKVPSLLLLLKRPVGFEQVEAVDVWSASSYTMPQAFRATVVAEPVRFSYLEQMRKLLTEKVDSVKDLPRISPRSRSVMPKAERIDLIGKFIDENMKWEDRRKEYEFGHISALPTNFDTFPVRPHETEKTRMLKEAGIGNIDVFAPYGVTPPQKAQAGQE